MPGLARLLLALFCLAPLLCSAAGTEPGSKEYERRTERLKAIQILILRADAESLAAAAALSFKQSTSPTALELAVSAAELAPQNPAIGWLHLQICVESPYCDFRDSATVLRWVDADNGASWLPVLAAARKDRDFTEVDRVLVDMAEAPRFDLYWNRLVVMMTDALKRAHPTLPKKFAATDAERLELVSETLSELIPPFSSILDACRGSTPASARHDACLALSHNMQQGDTVVAQIAGFGLERRMLPPDSKEAEKLLERRKLLEWRAGAAAHLDAAALPWLTNSGAHRRLTLMRSLPREEDVCIALLKEHKMATKP